jgi:hypothetical protein
VINHAPTKNRHFLGWPEIGHGRLTCVLPVLRSAHLTQAKACGYKNAMKHTNPDASTYSLLEVQRRNGVSQINLNLAESLEAGFEPKEKGLAHSG